MFKILGADGREYGPVTTEQLRQWIREGRAGRLTQAQPAGSTTWSPVSALPEFAAQFAIAPPAVPGTAGAMPPVVRTIAFAFFIAATIGALLLLMNILSVVQYLRSDRAHSGFLNYRYYLGWGIALVGLPIRVVSGIGLLRGREWARRLAVGFAIVFTIYGAWGLVQTAAMLAATRDASYMLRSPMFLFSHVWSLALFGFNIATVIFLCRKDVRAAFSKKSPAAT